jgi:signal peptidase I
LNIKTVLFSIASTILVVITGALVIFGVSEAYSTAKEYGESTDRAVGKYRIIVVTTPSMDPAMKVGSISLVKMCDLSDIELKDIIMYENSEEENIVHRVIEIDNIGGATYLLTKGDANREPDGILIDSNRFIGKVIVMINWISPLLKPLINGTVVEYSIVKLVIISIIIVYLLYTLIRQLILMCRAIYYIFIDNDKFDRYMRKAESDIEECGNAYKDLDNIERIKGLSVYSKLKYSHHMSKVIDSMIDIRDDKDSIKRRINKCNKLKMKEKIVKDCGLKVDK